MVAVRSIHMVAVPVHMYGSGSWGGKAIFSSGGLLRAPSAHLTISYRHATVAALAFSPGGLRCLPLASSSLNTASMRATMLSLALLWAGAASEPTTKPANAVDKSGGPIEGAPEVKSNGRLYTLQAHDGRYLALSDDGPTLVSAKRPPAISRFKRVSDVYIQFGNRLLSAASTASEAPDIQLARWRFYSRADGRIALQSQAGGYLRPAEVGVKRGGKLADEDVWWAVARPPSALTNTKVGHHRQSRPPASGRAGSNGPRRPPACARWLSGSSAEATAASRPPRSAALSLKPIPAALPTDERQPGGQG